TVPAIKKLISADAINVIDAPLLFESGADADCDVTVAVLAEREKRIERITARDGISRERAEARVDAQKKDEYYIKSADHIVNSNGEGLERAAASLKAKIFGINKNFAVYGGTFDPPTLGHLDVIKRAASVFGSVFAVVFENGGKHPAFLTERRVEMLKAITADITNVTVEQYGGLIAEYARGKKINFLVRGVRNASDADYERTMAEYNRQIAEEDFGFALETVLFPAARRHADTSSNNVRILLSSGAFKTAEKYLDERIHGMVFNNYK
ncbi:MAG: pantetheine-phosphate adenylyltransferase, partial [Defluviitaleaceae bacterium]|nr:pantetheine-phosphate adenylyltransferase [Defluviitaleaceae bacterium]